MLIIQNISFSYNETPVIDDISFTITKGQNVAIIGESGCGKSTLLQLIYGLYDLDQGTISYQQQPILGPKYNLIPGEDYIKYLAQDFDLMPYITVAENVGKFITNVYPEQKAARVRELLEIVEMTQYANVMAKTLSGGEQQRVALARVLALEPEILLLDEPFNHIDNFRKNALRRNLFAYLKAKEITCIVATHDSTDALSFADETIVMQNGSIIEKADSYTLYNSPSNRYTASLFGEINELKLSQISSIDGDDAMVILYPHQLKVDENGILKATVKHSYFKGNVYLIKAVFDRKVIFFEHETALEINAEVGLMQKRGKSQEERRKRQE